MHPQKAIHAASIQDPEAFWLRAARDIHWHTPPTQAFAKTQRANAEYTRQGASEGSWFPNAELNTCFNALDRHIYPPPHAGSPPLTPSPHTPHLAFDASLANRIAFHHVSPLPFQQQQYRAITYGEALETVQTLAGVLKSKGVKKGDSVIIYMPMIPEAALAMLAASRIGAIHSVVFGGFAAPELAKRIQDSKCKIVISASCGLEPKGPIEYKPLLDEALRISTHKPESGYVFLRRHTIKGHSPPEIKPDGQKGPSGLAEWDWDDEMDKTRRGVDGRGKCWSCVPVGSEEPAYTLYTSGTTGMPKGVVRLTGGHAVHLRHSIENTFGMTRDDTMLCASDLGWVVGHSYILYGPLLIGAATVIFEGKPVTPDAGILWRTITALGVTHLFTAPTALRAVRGLDPDASMMRGPTINLRTLRTLFLAGERSEPQLVSIYGELMKELGAPSASVNDNYWLTETGSPVSALMLGPGYAPLGAKPGSAGLPLPGMDVRIVDSEGKEVKQGEMGNLVLATPLAPSALGGLWRNPERFREAYFQRFEGKGDWFDTGDAAVMDKDGYITILARDDDLINVAGHRLGTGLIEQIVTGHPDVVESCVVGCPDKLKGTTPFALVVAKSSVKPGSSFDSPQAKEMLQSINAHIRKEIGAIAQLSALVLTPKIVKTRSGKTLRKTVRKIVENVVEGRENTVESMGVPPTIEDVDCLEDVKKAIEGAFREKEKGEGVKAKL